MSNDYGKSIHKLKEKLETFELKTNHCQMKVKVRETQYKLLLRLILKLHTNFYDEYNTQLNLLENLYYMTTKAYANEEDWKKTLDKCSQDISSAIDNLGASQNPPQPV